MRQQFLTSYPLPKWLRWVLVVFISIGLVDDIREVVVAWSSIVADERRQLLVLGLFVAYAVWYIAIWSAPVALLVAIPVLLLSLITASYLGAAMAVVFLVGIAAATTRWALTLATWAVALTWLVLVAVQLGPEGYVTFWSFLTLLVVSAVLGSTVHYFQGQHARDRRRLHELAEENSRIRDDERATLARELHDVVAHELSIMSLQITSRSRTDDPAELHKVLDSVRGSTQKVLYELRILVGLLRDGEQVEELGIDHLSDDTSVSRVGTDLAERLSGLGFDITVTVAPEVDRLPATLTRTVIRILQEACTNVLKHAPDGARTVADVRLNHRYVLVSVRNTLGPTPRRDGLRHGPTGWGLRGLTERVDLLGGRLEAGRQDEEWVLSARIPLPDDVEV